MPATAGTTRSVNPSRFSLALRLAMVRTPDAFFGGADNARGVYLTNLNQKCRRSKQRSGKIPVNRERNRNRRHILPQMTNVTALRFHELGESIMFQPTRGLLVSLGIALAFATLISRVPLNQTDVWLHLGFGRQWLETGKLNAGTLTPIAMPEAPGLNSYWLAQRAISWTWQVGGVAGIQALHALAILARLLAMALLLRACGVPDRRLVLVVVVTIGLALGHAPVFRPQAMAETFAAPLLILVLWPGLMWWPWIVAEILLGTWGLFHGSFLIGFPLATAVAIGQGLQGNSFKERVLPAGRWLAMGVIAIAILTVLHPSGFHALSDAINMGRNRAVRLQDEWRPLWTNRSIIPMMLWAASVAWWAWAMAVACRNEKIPWSCLLPGLILALTPLLHQRLLVWWYLSAPILVARAFRPDFAVQAPITWQAWAGLAAATMPIGPPGASSPASRWVIISFGDGDPGRPCCFIPMFTFCPPSTTKPA